MLNRSTPGRINCKFNRRIVLLLLAVAGLPLSTYADQFCVILDPYFYRSPLKIDLEGTTKTVLAFYRIVDDETLAPAKPQELNEEAQSAVRREATRRAEQLLRGIRPEIIRDSNGVILALRLQSPDPTLSAILLLPRQQIRELIGTRLLSCRARSRNGPFFSAPGDQPSSVRPINP